MYSRFSTNSVVRGTLMTSIVAQVQQPLRAAAERKAFHHCNVRAIMMMAATQLRPFRAAAGPGSIVALTSRNAQHPGWPLYHYELLPQQQTTTTRWVTSKKRARQTLRDQGRDAFLILGVSRKDTYAHIKATFLRLAMAHHPDTHAADTPEQAQVHRETFLAVRAAFETIVAGPDGTALLKAESDPHADEGDMDVWFKTETGYDMPFMDARTMREVAEMTETNDIGLDRDGGMWTLAKMVAQSVKEGGDASNLLRLEAGVVRDRNIDGILRRRRKR